MPVPVCCMFYVSQKTNIKQSPNRIKTDGELFWNICDLGEEESMRDGAQGGHEAGGTPQGGRRALDPRWHPIRQLTLFFCSKKANFMRKIWAKDSPQSELWIFGNLRNSERSKSGSPETEGHRERERSNLEGALAPPPPWRPWTKGETLLPSRGEAKEEGGGGSPPSLPVARECRRG